MTQGTVDSNPAKGTQAVAQTASPLAEVVTHSAEETINFGRKLAEELRPPCLVLLVGELGSGKTTLVKGIIAGLGAAREEEVTSPTFTLVHEYEAAIKVYHADLYRVEGRRELASLGLEDLGEPDAVLLVEWGEKLEESTPTPCIRIRLEYLASEDRRIIVERLES